MVKDETFDVKTLAEARKRVIELLAELRAKSDTIAQLESSARDNRRTIDRMDKEVDLYERIIDGLRAEVEMHNLQEKVKKQENLGPLMMGVLGGAVGSFIGGLVTKPKEKS